MRQRAQPAWLVALGLAPVAMLIAIWKLDHLHFQEIWAPWQFSLGTSAWGFLGSGTAAIATICALALLFPKRHAPTVFASALLCWNLITYFASTHKLASVASAAVEGTRDLKEWFERSGAGTDARMLTIAMPGPFEFRDELPDAKVAPGCIPGGLRIPDPLIWIFETRFYWQVRSACTDREIATYGASSDFAWSVVELSGVPQVGVLRSHRLYRLRQPMDLQ